MIYFGVVEDRISDPMKAMRYKVRVIGVHSPLTSELPTADLPWCTPIQNNSSAMSGIGQSANGYLQGSTVAIVFLDEDLQIPLILGAIAGVSSDLNYDGSELFKSLESDLSIIPPNAPKENLVKSSDGVLTPESKAGSITNSSQVIEQGYIGKLPASDVRKLTPFLETLRGQSQKSITGFGIGSYQFSDEDLINLGYKDLNLNWTGLNNITNVDQFLSTSGTQYDSEELLMKLNYTSLVKLGAVSKSTPKEKLAGMLLAAQVNGVYDAYVLVEESVDTTNSLGESCLKFYKEGYRFIVGKNTEELPTVENINDEASDKYENSTDTSKSKYDVKHVDKSNKNQGFKDPDNRYPLKNHINEPDTPRLATGLKVNETIVGLKETTIVKKVSIANSSVTWK